MKSFLTFLLLLGAAFAQNSTVRSVSTLPATCNPGGGAGGAPADHVDLWNGSANVAYYCSAANTWTPILTNAGVGLSSSSNTVNLQPALPSNETATTQPTGNNTGSVATTQFVQTAISAISPTPSYSGNQLISGGGVELVSGTLNVTVGAASYTIAGQQYSSPLTTVTLATADPTNPRIDLIGVNNTGSVFVITGTPAVTPVEPTANPATQLALTAVLVPANATSPSLNVTDIYHDCLEWTLTSSGAPINTCSTNNPYNGSNPKTIEATAAVAGNYAQLTDPSAGTVVLSNYNSFVFYIASKATWASTNSITIQWYNGSSPIGAAILLLPSGTFGFNSALTNYQQVSIPTSLFQASGIPVTSVRLTVSGSGASFGFYLADITLQGGQNGQPSGVFMNWRGAWNTTAGYNINDTVNYLGVSWVALAANLNSPPSSTNANWQQMTNPGSNQQVIYNCNGVLCGDPGMVYNQPTAALTINGNMSANAYISTGSGTYTLKGNAGSCVTGASSQDWLCFGTSHLQFSINAGALFNIPGIASAGTSGHCADFAANGIDLQDAGAACGTGGVTDPTTIVLTAAPYYASPFGATTTTGTFSGSATSGTVGSCSTFTANEGVLIAGGASGGWNGTSYIGTVVSCVGTTMTITPAITTGVTGATVQHDETAAFTSAITALASEGGTIQLPNASATVQGVYLVNGALQNTGTANAILQMPTISNVLALVNIKIQGLTKWFSSPIVQTALNTSGASLFGGYGSITPHQTGVGLWFQDVNVTGPTSGSETLINGTNLMALNFEGAVRVLGATSGIATTGNGVLFPAIGNNIALTVSGVLTSAGFGTAVRLGEHSTALDILVANSTNGVVFDVAPGGAFGDTTPNAISVGHLWCGPPSTPGGSTTVSNCIVGGSQATTIHIELVDYEGTGGTLINDSSNFLHGVVNYALNNTASCPTSPTLSGGSNLVLRGMNCTTGGIATATQGSITAGHAAVFASDLHDVIDGGALPSGTSNGTVTYTSSQTASSSDAGKLVIMNCSSACSYTLPASQPSTTWSIAIQTIGSANATIALGGGDTYNSGASVPVLQKYDVCAMWANTSTSTDYRGCTPLAAGTNASLSPTANALTVATTGGGGSGGWTNLSGSLTPTGCAFNAAGACVVGTAINAVSFTGVPSGYTALAIMAYGRVSDSAASEPVGMQFNSDTGNNYDNEFVYGTASTAAAGSSAGVTFLDGIDFAGATATTNVAGSANVFINNYADTNFYKSETSSNARILILGTTSNYLAVEYAGVWRSTSAITSIKFFDTNGGNISVNSSFTIWGVK